MRSDGGPTGLSSTFMRALLTPMLFIAACGPGPSGCPELPGDQGEGEFLSPTDGAILRVPWVPVVLHMDDERAGAGSYSWLDGVCREDPWQAVGTRAKVFGNGSDYITALDVQALEPGVHSFTAAVRSSAGAVAVARTVAFEVQRPEHQLRLLVPDQRPLRVAFFKDDAPHSLAGPDALGADPRDRDIHLSSLFVLGGERTLNLDAGEYTLVATRGLREGVSVTRVQLDGDAEVELVVPLRFPMWDRMSTDMHVHSLRSEDSFVPHRVRLESLAAAGLDLAVFTDHNLVTDMDIAMDRVFSPVRDSFVLPGVERTISVRDPDDEEDPLDTDPIGHFNAFPVTAASARSFPAKLDPVPDTLSAWRDRQRKSPYRGVETDLLLQLNHPRGIEFTREEGVLAGAHSLFNKLGFDAEQPAGEGESAWMLERSSDGESFGMDFDAMEVMNRFSLELYQELRRDWFTLLSSGLVVSGTGNSDSHALEVERVGFPVNLLHCPRPFAGVPPSRECLIQATRQGRLSVSTGPIVDLTLRSSYGEAELGGLAGPGPQEALVRVRAAEWVPVQELRLVVDGELVLQQPVDAALRSVDGVLDITVSVPLELTRDSWVLAEAGWPLEQSYPDNPLEALGLYHQVAPNYLPIGFTNPIWVDGDGDGRWR